MPSNNEYMTRYINYRYLKLKIRAVEYKGGKCIKCGFDKYYALTFHHRTPSEKDFDWNRLRKQSWETIQKELNKCDMLCHNCHSAVHYDENELGQMELFFATRKKSQEPQFTNCPTCATKFRITRDRKIFCCTKCRYPGKAD